MTLSIFNMVQEMQVTMEVATVTMQKIENKRVQNVLTQPTVTQPIKATKKAKVETQVTSTEFFIETVSDVLVELVEQTKENLGEEVSEDVRAERQRHKKVAYDVGTKIGGARKDINEWKRKFLNNPSSMLLDEIADMDDVVAGELANKKNVFSWFGMEDLFNKGVEIQAAYGMHLLIRRLPTNAKGLNRKEYMNSLEFISDQLKTIYTFKQLGTLLNRFSMLVLSDSIIEWNEKKYKSAMDQLEAINLEINEYQTKVDESKIKKCEADLRDATCYILAGDVQEEFGLSRLGSFSDLLGSYKKRNVFRDSAQKYSDWTAYFDEVNAKKEKQSDNQSKPRKSVWERELPIQLIRKGGKEIEKFRLPEEYRKMFGFRGVESGIWVEDDVCLSHLVNSAGAFTDLAGLLEIDEKHISLGFQLAIAIGARGKSRALAHFERGYNVINFTKLNGSNGVAAHEWFHAYDYYLKNVLTNNQSLELLTEGQGIEELPFEVAAALQDLTESFKVGESLDFFEIDPLASYTISPKSKELFANLDYDVTAFVDERMKDFDSRVERALKGYLHEGSRKKAEASYARKRKKELRTSCEVAAILHREHTGEQLYQVPYTTNLSQFYSTAISLDRKKIGKYWSSDKEMAARAFEAYIATKLSEKGMVNHYLVCGLDYVYPKGEELQRINWAMEEFLRVTLPYLRKEPTEEIKAAE